MVEQFIIYAKYLLNLFILCIIYNNNIKSLKLLSFLSLI